MRDLAPRICLTLLLLSFTTYLLVSCDVHLSIYDEAASLYGAVRVMDGELPYRDFWMVYPPGIFYTLAALFSMFFDTHSVGMSQPCRAFSASLSAIFFASPPKVLKLFFTTVMPKRSFMRSMH